MSTLPHPGGEIARRALEFFWVCDTSGSMGGAKIEALNFAIRDAWQPLLDAARSNPQADVFVRVACFDDDARWVVGERTPLGEFAFAPLRVTPRSFSAMGAALQLVAAAMRADSFPKLYYPPVVALVTDGFATDHDPALPTFAAGLSELLGTEAGHSALRVAIAIGSDTTGADEERLRQFNANPKIPLLHARDAEELAGFVRMASTAAVGASASPAARASDAVLFAGEAPAAPAGTATWEDAQP